MVSLHTPICEFGKMAPNFKLPGVDGQVWSLEKCRGEHGLLVMFISNHCPYVKAIRNKLVRDTRQLMTLGINIHPVDLVQKAVHRQPSESDNSLDWWMVDGD